jgi:hypothetical protein
MANKSSRVGDPAAHRRMLGPYAARRLDALVARAGGDGKWRSLDDLATESDGAFSSLTTAGALCSTDDLGAAVAQLRRVLEPGGHLAFVEHVGHPGALGAVQRLSEPVYAAVPGGCHVRRDVPAALREGGFTIDALDRVVIPGLVPLLRHWVRGVARSRP